MIESLTLEEALALFSLPRNLGPYEGEDLVIGIGKFGPYVRHGKSFASLARTDDPYTIGYDRAAELVREQQARAAAANTPLKTFAEEPELLIKNGRYGPYIAYKGKNYRIPKGTKPEEITLEACMKIIQTSKLCGRRCRPRRNRRHQEIRHRTPGGLSGSELRHGETGLRRARRSTESLPGRSYQGKKQRGADHGLAGRSECAAGHLFRRAP